VKALGLPEVQRTLYGAPRVRKKKRVDDGNFTAQYSRILEGFEVDAYYVSERPSAMFGDGPADRLAVARGVDCTTSSVTGVGFSIGAENGEAYRAMLFFGVAPTEYLEKIYGIPAGHLSDMHTLGLPSNFRSDRGPAGYRKLVNELEVKFPMKSVVPSYEPGSKALVESGHPRDVQLEGPPSYVQSELSIPKMIKREIYQLRLDNLSSDISARLTDEQIIEFDQKGLLANPRDYATYLIDKVATAGRKISLQKAVRAFWTPIKLTLSKDGVHYRHRYFRSAALDATGAQDRLGLLPSIEVDGYCLSAVFLAVWVEIDGQLVEVEPVMRARQDREDLLTSMSDVEATAIVLKRIKSKSRTSALAARSDCKAKFKEATNQEWDAGRRVGGIPKKAKGTVAHEMIVAKGKSKVSKVA
jgi:hypothetical protein